MLALKLRKLRHDRQLTQKETADLAGMNLRSYQRIEANEAGSTSKRRCQPTSNPQIDTIFRLAFVLEVDVSYLIDPAREVEPVPPRRRPAVP